MREITMLSRIAVCQPVDAHLNTGAAGSIFQVIDPVPIDLGHRYAHDPIVSYGIRVSRVV